MEKTYEAVDAEALVEANPNVSYSLIAHMVGTGKFVLDVGCGPGNLAAVLKARGSQVVGLDADESSLRAAARHCVRTGSIDLDATPLNRAVADDERFDVVVFADVLEHLRDPARALASARSVLKPGGFVVASIPNVAHGAVRLALLHGRFEYQRLGILDDTHVRFFTYDSVERLFAESGYVIGGTERTTAEVFEESDLVPLVRREDFDPNVVDEVLADPEADTLQFVVRGYPVDDEDLVVRLRSEIAGLEQFVRTLRAELARARSAAPPGAAMMIAQGEYLPATDGDSRQIGQRLAQVESEYRQTVQLSDGLRRQLAHRDAIARAERARLAGEITRIGAQAERLHAELATVAAERGALASEVAQLAQRDAEWTKLSAELRRAANENALRGAEFARMSEEIERANADRERVTAQLARVVAEHRDIATRLAFAERERERLGERLDTTCALLDAREASARDQDAAADRLLTALDEQRRAMALTDALALDARGAAAVARIESAAEAARPPRGAVPPPEPPCPTTRVIVHGTAPPGATVPLRTRLRAALRRVLEP